MIASLMGGGEDIVSLLVRFCVLTKEGAVGFGFCPNKGGLVRPSCPVGFGAKSDPDGENGVEGGGGGTPEGSGGRAGSDIDGNLSEDASSDKIRGVKNFPKRGNFKSEENRGSGAWSLPGDRECLLYILQAVSAQTDRVNGPGVIFRPKFLCYYYASHLLRWATHSSHPYVMWEPGG